MIIVHAKILIVFHSADFQFIKKISQISKLPSLAGAASDIGSVENVDVALLVGAT